MGLGRRRVSLFNFDNIASRQRCGDIALFLLKLFVQMLLRLADFERVFLGQRRRFRGIGNFQQ